MVGGDRINHPGEVATPTADMMVAKLLFNSVVSTKDAKFTTMDISIFLSHDATQTTRVHSDQLERHS